MTVEKTIKSQQERVADKYGKMCEYYAHLLATCHSAVKNNKVLSALDPMGQKTSATTLFIRVCSRMDASETTKQTAEQMIKLSEKSVNNLSESA